MTVVDATSGELIGTIETARAFTTAHQGAVYLHLGRAYEVGELDVEQRRAIVQPFDGDWYTQAKVETETVIERLLDRRETLGVQLSFGVVSVTEQVLAYQRKGLADHEARDLIALDLPETPSPPRRSGTSWTSDLLADDFPLELLLGSLHAAEHGQIAVLPLIAMCDRWDIGGLSTNFHAQTGKPTIFIYDGHPGGIGITRRGFTRVRDAGARRLPADLRMPLPGGLPLLRAVAQVRQPQRAPGQGRLGGGHGAHAGALRRFLQVCAGCRGA